MDIGELKISTKRVRRNIVKMIYKAGSGHPGGSLSSADLMTTLYLAHLRKDINNPGWTGRDRVIFSKGHASALLYACLAEAGFFPEEELTSFRKLGSRLQGHPSRDKGLPGVDVSSGSLGHGLSIGVGMALALRLDKKDSRVYVLMGDGECDSGQIWEAAICAGHYKLDNLCGILDYNQLQIDGQTEKVMGLEPIVQKWIEFRWNVIEIDGHNYSEIEEAYKQASQTKGKPTIIIAHTIKGKGVSYMENNADWHGKAPNKEQMEMALKELGKDD